MVSVLKKAGEKNKAEYFTNSLPSYSTVSVFSYSSIPLNMVRGSIESASFPVTRSMHTLSPTSRGRMMLKMTRDPGVVLVSAIGFSRPSGWYPVESPRAIP